MTHQEIIEFWGLGRLARWNSAALEETSLPEEAKRFLVDVGLPWELEYSTLRFACPRDKITRLSRESAYIVIGHDEHVPICLDEEMLGQVICVDPARGEAVVNSSVEIFGLFLVFYERYRVAARKISDDQFNPVIKEMIRAMTATDPECLRDEKSFWPEIIQQVREGFL